MVTDKTWLINPHSSPVVRYGASMPHAYGIALEKPILHTIESMPPRVFKRAPCIDVTSHTLVAKPRKKFGLVVYRITLARTVLLPPHCFVPLDLDNRMGRLASP